MATACIQEEDRCNTGKPAEVVERTTNRTPARDRPGARGAERPVVPPKSGNADGGKGPQFKTDARSSEEREIGQPSNSAECSEATDGVTCQSEGRPELSVLRPVRQAVSSRRTCNTPTPAARPIRVRPGWTTSGSRTSRRTGWSDGSGNWRRNSGEDVPTASGATSLHTEAEWNGASASVHSHDP